MDEIRGKQIDEAEETNKAKKAKKAKKKNSYDQCYVKTKATEE